MAGVMEHVLRAGKVLVKNVCQRTALVNQNTISFKNVRFLFSDQFLGLDKYQEHRERTDNQFTGLKEKFFSRMKQERQSMVFTEDLKNVLHMAENKEEDIQICVDLMKKYHKQNKELRFGTFVFGPVVMRWIHYLDNPDLASELLNCEELTGFFDQFLSYKISMDLLFKHKRYQEVLTTFDQLKKKDFVGNRIPRDSMLLALGACHHLNTPESLQKSTEIIQCARGAGETIMRRGVTLAANLALKQGSPDIAMELLSLTPFSHYVTVRNLRLRVLAELDRLDEIFPILRQVVDREHQSGFTGAICQETLDHIERKVSASEDKEMIHIFEQICRALGENNHITSETLEEMLDRPVQAMRTDRAETKQPQGWSGRSSRSFHSSRGVQFEQRQITDTDN